MTQSNSVDDQIDVGLCQRCGKSKTGQGKVSISSWLFRTSSCVCPEAKNAEIKPKDDKPARNRITGGEIKAPEIKNYDVVDFIGQGGMGSVYKVKEEAQGKELAIKVLRPEFVPDHIAVKRFEQEAIAASKLTHPNLVQVFGHGKTDDGSPYLIMEYLSGESLGSYIDRVGKISLDTTLDIFIQVCGALSHAHSKGVIHRDLTPGNIILTFSKNGEVTARVVDFGIAKIQHDMRSTQDLTETGSVLGSPSYMSPEQCLGVNIDLRADIYSLGCVLYESLTGEELYSGENPVQVIAKHLEDTPDKVHSSKEIPRHLVDVITTCLQKDINDRYQTTVELGIDLQRIKEGKAPEFCRLSEDSLERFSKKRPVILSGVAMAAMVSFCFIFSFFPQLEVFSILKFCLMIISVVLFGVSISKIIKTVLSCTLRTVRLIDLVLIPLFITVLYNCFLWFMYSISGLAGLHLNVNNIGCGFVPAFSISAVLLATYLILSNSPKKDMEVVRGKFDTRGFRFVVASISSVVVLVLGYIASQKSYQQISHYLNPGKIETNWAKEQEIAFLSKLIKFHSKNALIKNNKIVDQYRYIRALSYFTNGEIKKALDDFNLVIRGQGPCTNAARVERAVILWAQGKTELADVEVRKVLEDDPEYRDAQAVKGYLSFALNHPKDAIEYYKKARKQKSTGNLVALMYLAYRMDKQDSEAEKLLKDYMKYSINDQTAQYLLGRRTFNSLTKDLTDDDICNKKVFAGWKLYFDGYTKEAKEKFQDVVTYVDGKGLKWYYGVYYSLAKAGLKRIQSDNKV